MNSLRLSHTNMSAETLTVEKTLLNNIVRTAANSSCDGCPDEYRRYPVGCYHFRIEKPGKRVGQYPTYIDETEGSLWGLGDADIYTVIDLMKKTDYYVRGKYGSRISIVSTYMTLRDQLASVGDVPCSVELITLVMCNPLMRDYVLPTYTSIVNKPLVEVYIEYAKKATSTNPRNVWVTDDIERLFMTEIRVAIAKAAESTPVETERATVEPVSLVSQVASLTSQVSSMASQTESLVAAVNMLLAERDNAVARYAEIGSILTLAA